MTKTGNSGSKTAIDTKLVFSDSSTANKQVRITEQQLLVLQLIYRFRFVSTKHVQALLNKKQIQQAQQRLNLLLRKGYVGRNFSPQDRLTGRYASYYLLPKGMRILKQYEKHLSRKPEPQVFHNIYKDKTASPRFIKHQLDLGDIALELSRIYGDIFHLLTKSELTIYEYLPELLPDSFVYMQDPAKPKSKRTSYFLEYLEDNVPFWVCRNRIKQYETYRDEGDWESAIDDEAMPKILLVCESPTLQQRMIRFLTRFMTNTYEEMTFYILNRGTLDGCTDPKEKIWRGISDESDGEVLFDSL